MSDKADCSNDQGWNEVQILAPDWRMCDWSGIFGPLKLDIYIRREGKQKTFVGCLQDMLILDCEFSTNQVYSCNLFDFQM